MRRLALVLLACLALAACADSDKRTEDGRYSGWYGGVIGGSRPVTALPAKTISCGVIVTDGKRLVLGHATRSPRWDIPKGGIERGETLEQTARRELREETGLAAPTGALSALGTFPYLRDKDLALFAWVVPRIARSGDADLLGILRPARRHAAARVRPLRPVHPRRGAAPRSARIWRGCWPRFRSMR